MFISAEFQTESPVTTSEPGQPNSYGIILGVLFEIPPKEAIRQNPRKNLSGF